MTRPRDWATGGGLLGLDGPGEWDAAFERGERDDSRTPPNESSPARRS
ncbi:hypothetical protein [Streptomyces sp. NPDC102370]